MTHNVDQRVARRLQQPDLWILRQAIARPSRERCYQRTAKRVLRAGHVARVRGKVRHQAAVGLSSHALDGPSSTLLLSAFAHPVTRCRYSTETGRTSTAPIEAAGQRAAQSSAASS